ncbi:MAG: GAK system CofD-like protein [Gemmatimonadota bacterium]|nr:GAK system CofD-like protein [Gemmatimonadota bacterium]
MTAVPLERYRHAPELGPAPLFFSGGNGLRTLSRHLVELTHNSIHLVTPFDSGGSSAELRRAFRMPAVGDLRNRLLALADPTTSGTRELHDLLAFRLPSEGEPEALNAHLARMVAGSDPLVAAIPEPLRGIVRNHLDYFVDAMPRTFDLRGAAIGNLVLTGGYLSQDRDLERVVHFFSRLVKTQGVVRPIVDADLHLAAELRDGRRVAGQHRITGKGAPPLTSPVERLFLTESLMRPAPHRVPIDKAVARLIEGADLICYPVGSFYSSLLATLLPDGVADAVVRSDAPKVYVPNPDGTDPEERGLDLRRKVLRLLACLDEGTSEHAAPARLVRYVVVDPEAVTLSDGTSHFLQDLGIELVDTRLLTPERAPYYDDERLAATILSLV